MKKDVLNTVLRSASHRHRHPPEPYTGWGDEQLTGPRHPGSSPECFHLSGYTNLADAAQSGRSLPSVGVFSGLLFPGPRCVFSVYDLVYHDPMDAIQQRRDGRASGALQISRRLTYLIRWSPNTWAARVGLTGDCSRRSPVSRTAN